jgi:hypothetical protein
VSDVLAVGQGLAEGEAVISPLAGGVEASTRNVARTIRPRIVRDKM